MQVEKGKNRKYLSHSFKLNSQIFTQFPTKFYSYFHYINQESCFLFNAIKYSSIAHGESLFSIARKFACKNNASRCRCIELKQSIQRSFITFMLNFSPKKIGKKPNLSIVLDWCSRCVSHRMRLEAFPAETMAKDRKNTQLYPIQVPPKCTSK